MRIAICVKQVPDTWAEKKLLDGVLDRASVDPVINSIDEFAIEEALLIAERHGGHGPGTPNLVTLVSMGPASAEAMLRKALAFGADEAILISDEKLAGSDAPSTAKVLAAVIREGNFDLAICGTESTDARMSVIPAMLAAQLGWAQLTFANHISVNPESKTIEIKRITNESVDHISASFPAVISVVEKINEPRYPSFKEIMAAKKKTIAVKNLAGLGIEEVSVGSVGSWSQVKRSLPSPPRQAGVLIKDEGSVGKFLVDFLKEKEII